jgi:hypothetical protein
MPTRAKKVEREKEKNVLSALGTNFTILVNIFDEKIGEIIGNTTFYA